MKISENVLYAIVIVSLISGMTLTEIFGKDKNTNCQKIEAEK